MRIHKPVWVRLGLSLTGLLIVCSSFASSSKYTTDTTNRAVQVDIVKDNPIVAMLDSLARYTFTGFPDYAADRAPLNVYNYPEGFVPTFSDSVYAARIRKMDEASTYGYVYNAQVKLYIDLYAKNKRALTSKILGMAKIYFPLFEEQLDRHGMPLELKYLAVIESALNPVAKSPVGAKGLWQFMYNTGKMYDLKVTTLVDDRNDPYKATIAACQHMQDLYCIYHDWSLVLAAYNAGAGNVNKAIRRAGGAMDYWTVQRFLPKETQAYVPAFIAASYVLMHAAEHNLYPVYPGITATEIDSVCVKQFLTFDQISEMFAIPIDNIRFLNPAYTKDIIPSTAEKFYYLRLPRANVADFINNEAALYAYRTSKMQDKDKFIAQVKESQERSTLHVVKKGETLASIAKKYHVRTTDIKQWNRLSSNYVKPRQELYVYIKEPKVVNAEDKAIAQSDTGKTKTTSKVKVDPPYVISVPLDTFDYKTYYNTLAAQNKGNLGTGIKKDNKTVMKDSKVVYHTIRSGDTLWRIANQYKGSSVQQIRKQNNIHNDKNLKPGQKIKISLEG